MPTTSYGAYNPNAVDPWPIEQTLAPLAVGGSQAEAQRMLGQYQEQRQAAGNVYGDELAKQHQFNRDQLAQQLYEAKLKETAPLLNAPGGAHLLGAGGIPGMDLGVDPTVMQGIIGAADMSQASKNFQAAGQGYNQFAQGGLQVNPQQVPGMAGVQGDVTGPALVRAALIRAQQSAANNAARGAKEAMTTVSNVSAPNAYGETTSTSRKVPVSQVEQEQADIEARNQRIRDKRAGNPPSSGSGSSLQPNQQSTGGGGGNKPGPLDTNSPNGKMAQGGATIMVDRDSRSSDPVAKQRAADIQGGMRSGSVYDTHMNANGKAMVKGKSGNFYPITN